MKHAECFTIIFLIMSAQLGLSQTSDYLWSSGTKMKILENRSRILVILKDGRTLDSIAKESIVKRQYVERLESFDDDRGLLVMFSASQPKPVLDLAQELGISLADVEWASFGSKTQGDSFFEITNQIVFVLKDGVQMRDVDPFIPDQAVHFRSSFDNIILKVPGQVEDILSICNQIYETGLVKFCHPVTVVHPKKSSDPLYPDQFYLNNTGQQGGTANIDIDAPEAWGITTGSSIIKVAVIDEGVGDHEDMNDESGNSRVLAGTTPGLPGGNGRPLGQYTYHGQCSAGIISASHNEFGIRGLAPKVKILPVNIFRPGRTNQDIADGINWAWLNGADVISNGWYLTSGDFGVITNAINNARTQGRGGKGCVVVAAAGNSVSVLFPATIAGVVSVGAIDKNANLEPYSPTSGKIDLVAVSGTNGMVTTDLMGSDGQNAGNYTYEFGLTSAAGPQVSATFALVLSINPNLTETQAKNVVFDSVIPMGEGDEPGLGRGRVNAHKAVLKVLDDLALQNISFSSFATAANNQRKMHRESSGTLHEIFESGNQVFYRRSTDDGFSWTTTKRLTDGTASNIYPSIVGRNSNLYVIWQRANGSNWDIVYTLSSNGGQSWSSPYIKAANVTCPAPGPLPVVMASTPSTSFQLLIVYKQTNSLISEHSTFDPPSSGYWTTMNVGNTNSQSRNPGFGFDNSSGRFALVWNDDNKIYHEVYYTYYWANLTWVSSGSYMVSDQSFPSYALTSSMDKHIAWEGNYNGYRAIVENKNLSSFYYVISGSYVNYYGATVTGNNNDKATLSWYDNSNTVWYTYVIGGYGQGNTPIASSSKYPSLSLSNPPGGTAKAVWTSGAAAPYTVQVGSQVFQKRSEAIAWMRERILNIADSATGGIVSVGFGAMTLKTADGGKLSLPLLNLTDDEAKLRLDPASYLQTEKFLFPANVDSVSVEHIIRMNKASEFGGTYAASAELVPSDGDPITISDLNLASFGDSANKRIESKLSSASNISKLSGKTVFMRLNLRNLDVDRKGLQLSLFNVHRSVKSQAEAAARDIEIINSGQAYYRQILTLDSYPNPFNPTTQIRFQLRESGSFH